MEIKKVVVKLNIHDNKDKQKAIKAVSSLQGIDSIAVDMKESKMTVIGYVDPVDIVRKLKKQYLSIASVGPAKEEKKEEKKGGNTKQEVPNHHMGYPPPYYPPSYYWPIF